MHGRGIPFIEFRPPVAFADERLLADGAGLRNMFGGRSQGYEEELMRARNEAIAEMQQRAEAMGAHAVVGVDIDYEVLGADNGMLMVTASGTAVQIARTA